MSSPEGSLSVVGVPEVPVGSVLGAVSEDSSEPEGSTVPVEPSEVVGDSPLSQAGERSSETRRSRRRVMGTNTSMPRCGPGSSRGRSFDHANLEKAPAVALLLLAVVFRSSW